jgi:hypothetical protein
MAAMSQNQKLFREMSEPFENAEVANKAINEFFEELGELRKKHKMTNVHTIVAGSFTASDGDESEWMTSCHYGDSMKAEMMAVWSYGQEAVKRQETFGHLMKGVMKKR